MENKEEKKETGLRYNSGKIRHDLVEPFALNELARVYTKGAEKYAPHNYLKGMSWTTVLASLKRHLNAFERGEDFDHETFCYHSAHIAWNAMALTSYYKFCPEFDDRLHNVLPKKRIGLDIDETICGFINGWCEKHNCSVPSFWSFDYEMKEKMDEMSKDEDFWLNLKPIIDPKDLPFEPDCYISTRTIPVELTKAWISKNGFPCAPVIHVKPNESKVQAAKDMNLDWFFDDSYKQYIDLNKNGICCFLITAEHNKRYNVGFKRVDSLKEFGL